MPTDWRALGMGRAPAVPGPPDTETYLARLQGLLGGGGPSVGARMAELERMRSARMAGGGGGPPAPDSPEAMLGMDVASNFDMTGGILGGVKAKTANLAKLKIAEEMERGDYHPSQVWINTGWWRGPDEEWRFEIPDFASKMKSGTKVRDARFSADISKDVGLPLPKGMGLDEILSHPELKQAYPELFTTGPGGLEVFLNNFNQSYGANADRVMGGLNPNTESLISDLPTTIELNTRLKPLEQRDTLLHELQHRIQQLEGFEQGANPSMVDPKRTPEYRQLADSSQAIEDALDKNLKSVGVTIGQGRRHLKGRSEMEDALAEIGWAMRPYRKESPFDLYQRVMGEAEARAVQARRDMPPDMAARSYPPNSYDRDIGSLIPAPP